MVSFGNAVATLAFVYGFAAFLVPLSTELGLSRTAISAVVSLASVLNGLIGPPIGWLTDRFGPRALALPGMVLMGLGYILLSRVNSELALFMVYLFGVSLWFNVAFATAPLVVIANWFRRKRAMAMGIGLTGIGVGGLAVPLVTLSVSSYGWRAASVFLALLILAVSLPFAYFMRERPEHYGMHPDGATPEPVAPGQQARDQDEPQWTPGQAMRTRAFWMLALGFTTRNFIWTGTLTHVIASFNAAGVSSQTAAAMVGVMSLVGIIGRFGLGWLGDFMSKRWLLAGSMVLAGLSLIALMNIGRLWLAGTALAVLGATGGSTIVLTYVIRADYFGVKTYGAIAGWTQAVTTIGAIIGPLLAGYLYDVTGGYAMSYLMMSMFAFLGAVLYLFATPPKPSLKGESLGRG